LVVEFLDQMSAHWWGNSGTDLMTQPDISWLVREYQNQPTRQLVVEFFDPTSAGGSIRHQLIGAGILDPTVLWNSWTRCQLVGPEIPEPTTQQRVVEFLKQM
jgi:hypothetical protein